VTETELRDRPLRPRIEIEPLPAPRLESTELVVVPDVPKERSSVSLVLGGATLLALGLAALATGNFVAAQFARASGLGWLTLAVALAGFGLIGAGAVRELRGLFGLRSVDRLRAILAGDEVPAMRQAAAHWLAGLPEGAATAAAVETVDEPEAIRALLRAGPLATLRARSDALGRTAAVQMFAAAAAIPHPVFDGLLVAWRGTRLVRQIAELHGMRPGFLATLSLLRRTALSAAGVVATDLAVDAITRAVLSNPLLQHVAGDVAGAGVAARRMVVLARAAAAACSPVPPG
jgi:putative membrane protein